MSRYILIRRLYGPAFLLLVGVDALLDQANILTWGQSWPFYLILLGVLKLAERAALASEGYPQSSHPAQGYVPGAPYSPYPNSPYPGHPYPGHPYAGQPYAAPAQEPITTPAPADPGTSMVPTIPLEIVQKPEDKGPEGGQQ